MLIADCGARACSLKVDNVLRDGLCVVVHGVDAVVEYAMEAGVVEDRVTALRGPGATQSGCTARS